MQDFPLTITAILRHGRRVYADSECVTWTDDGRPARDLRRGRRQRGPARGRARRSSACATATGSARSAGTRRSTSRRTSRCRAMGAVLHTLNIRLFPEQLAYVINHAEDKRHHRRRLARSRCWRKVVGRPRRPSSSSSSSVTATRRALGDRRRAALPRAPRGGGARASTGPRSTNAKPRRCVTRRARPATRRASRTRTARRTCTRSSATTPTALGLSERDRMLTIVPMFHANAWGIPYAAFICGASLVMPGRFLQAEPLTRMIKEEQRHVLGRGADDLGRHPALRRGARDRPVDRCAWSSAAVRPCRAR